MGKYVTVCGEAKGNVLPWKLLNLLTQAMIKNMELMSNAKTNKKIPGMKATPTDTSDYIAGMDRPTRTSVSYITT